MDTVGEDVMLLIIMPESWKPEFSDFRSKDEVIPWGFIKYHVTKTWWNGGRAPEIRPNCTGHSGKSIGSYTTGKFCFIQVVLYSSSVAINSYVSSVGPVLKSNGGINSSRFIPVSVEYKATICRWDSRWGDYIMVVVSPGSLTWD
jgi:hypothetical protein